jgi:hypothetical protein
MRDINEMAKEAGLRDWTCNGKYGCLERFAELVRADEREQALAAPVQLVAFEVGLVEWVGNKLMATPKTTTTAPAAPVQEPVAWAMYQRGRLQSFWLDKGDAYDFEFTTEHQWQPLYTTPPAQPAPVPLTDEQIAELFYASRFAKDEYDSGANKFARAIEAAHGITEKGQP